MSFNQLNLHERILNAVDDAGYTVPTPIQEKAIPVIVQGRDLIGIAQTGTGKTAAFVLPMISKLCNESGPGEVRATKVLILAPTRELVSQINQNIRTYAKYTNLRSVVISGGVGETKQIEKLGSGVDIVIATPGRLQDLAKRGFTRFDKIDFLVLDEADRMLDMGFLPAIEELVKPLPKKRQTLLFSATLSKQVEKLANSFLTQPETVEVGDRTNPAETVTQYLYPVARHLKPKLLVHLLKDETYFAIIVFVRTRIEADVLAQILRAEKVSVVAIHGDKTQNHRNRAIKDFAACKIRVLVATDVAARGLDIPGVTHVINYDFPEQNDDYIHRIGRTGRAGSTGVALTFITPTQGEKLEKLERYIKRTLAKKRVPGFDYEEEKSDEYRTRLPERKKYSLSQSKYSRSNKPAAKVWSKDSKKKKQASSKAGAKPSKKKASSERGKDSKKFESKERGKFSKKAAKKGAQKSFGKPTFKGARSSSKKKSFKKKPRR